MKILIVDDDPIVLDSCRLILEAEGFDVFVVPSAKKALDAMKNDHFDLLLIDVKMPGHDGMYLMKEVKERWPEIPVIVMSGYPTPETITDGIAMGAAKFIAKPFTPDELLEIVRQVIQKEESREAEKGPRD
jgi:DNA-binding NtrC family response regulator